MFKIIESNGQKYELTVNSATALVYKQVFKTEIMKELSQIDIKAMSQLSKLSKEDQIASIMANSQDILTICDIFIKLGFIMIRQGLPFQEYWNRTTYDDYVEWRATQESKTLMTPEFIGGVANLWMDDQKGNSESKN